MAVSLPNHERTWCDQARSVAAVIADPHPASRRALRIALEDTETVRVVGEAPDLTGAIKAVSVSQVDIVLAHSRVAGIGSESARAGLVQLSRLVPVIVMGMGDPRVYTAPLQAAGAAGYWPKDGELAQLIQLLSTPEPRTSPDRNSQHHQARARTRTGQRGRSR